LVSVITVAQLGGAPSASAPPNTEEPAQTAPASPPTPPAAQPPAPAAPVSAPASPPAPVAPAAASSAPTAAAPALRAPADIAPPSQVGFAVELGTGGLSGTVGGALGLGGGSRDIQLGFAFDVSHSNVSDNQDGGTQAQSTNALAVGPWLRWSMAHTLDGRVDFIGAVDAQYVRQSTTSTPETPANFSGSTSGVLLRVGPGIRFWATRWLSLAYTTQLSLAHLSGSLIEFSPLSTFGSTTGDLSSTELGLVGRFSVLALF
jgi:hypothetical protein